MIRIISSKTINQKEDDKMGVSTNGILCYGFRIKDEYGNEEDISIEEWLHREHHDDEESEIDLMGFDGFLAKLTGLNEPYNSFNQERFDADPDYAKGWRDYWAKKDKLEEEVGVTLVYHCSNEYTMYILAATASVQTANRGYPVELGQSIAAQEGWRQKIRAFCERINVPFEEPQFILCSYWG